MNSRPAMHVVSSLPGGTQTAGGPCNRALPLPWPSARHAVAQVSKHMSPPKKHHGVIARSLFHAVQNPKTNHLHELSPASSTSCTALRPAVRQQSRYFRNSQGIPRNA